MNEWDGWRDRYGLTEIDRQIKGHTVGHILVRWAQNKTDYKKLDHVQKTPRNIQYSCTLSKNTKHFV